ncbi:YecH family metal-binding protein [Celerinatantimonas yamalensis]|uniref:YecH family metal-binding protein n=1 Tax=Celerinatantimonas yamalensis TaxID=559956 RepID=A0ABW9G1A4_9GAMM
MTQSIHGHEVMKMMLSSDQSYSRESLCAAILAKYGQNTRFHTCSKENMRADELVDFLQSRGKFVTTQNGFTTLAEKICNH